MKQMRKMKWCPICDKWKEFRCRNSKKCIDCAEKSLLDSKKKKGYRYNDDHYNWKALTGVSYGDYMKSLKENTANNE